MKTHVISNYKVAMEWYKAFCDRQPVELDGKKYLIGEASTEYSPTFKSLTCGLTPCTEATAANAQPSEPVNFAAMPEGTTHVCVKSSSLWRKAANGVAFAWVNACWQQIGALAETWQPIVEATALQDEEKQYLLGTPVKARQVLRDSARLTARRWFEGAALFVPGDYIACNWPRSHYLGRGLNFPCTRVPVEPAQWDGEGLPPVGVDCEVLWSTTTREYVTCRVVGHDEWSAVYRLTSGERKGGYESGRDEVYPIQGDPDGALPNFRPIKTAEQLAAEQREAEVGRIRNVINDALSVAGDPAVALHNLGVRVWGDK